tara:strand:- start:1909 stop:2235 length:327 start_codon:yes stop_codon:yes gene_type:complete
MEVMHKVGQAAGMAGRLENPAFDEVSVLLTELWFMIQAPMNKPEPDSLKGLGRPRYVRIHLVFSGFGGLCNLHHLVSLFSQKHGEGSRRSNKYCPCDSGRKIHDFGGL